LFSHNSNSSDLSFLVMVSKSLDINSFFKKVFVALQWIIDWVEVFVWWSMGLLERSVFCTLSKIG
jgi:hypothetical protein